jgi:hypothetical protein
MTRYSVKPHWPQHLQHSSNRPRSENLTVQLSDLAHPHRSDQRNIKERQARHDTPFNRRFRFAKQKSALFTRWRRLAGIVPDVQIPVHQLCLVAYEGRAVALAHHCAAEQCQGEDLAVGFAQVVVFQSVDEPGGEFVDLLVEVLSLAHFERNLRFLECVLQRVLVLRHQE